jgi:hypothetical protein
MLPWNPPLWLTVTVVAIPIAINLIAIISKKIVTERLNGEQENEPHSKDVAYWTHAIASRIAIVVNVVATAIAIPLLLIGTTWIGINFPHVFFITMCALMGILSLYLTWSFFQVRNKSHDTDVQGSNALIDPNDRAAINYAIGWILVNVALDAFMWLVMSHPWTTHY